MTIRIKDWGKFQHFKDRKPPWVKLYRDILDDIDWHELDPKAAKVLVSLWLIASEFDGELPVTKKLAFRLRMSEKDTLDVLSNLSHWLEQDDIDTISGWHQSDAPETETETKKRKTTSAAKLPTVPTQSIVDLYHEVLPELPGCRVMDKDREKAIREFWTWVLTTARPDGTPRASNADEALAWTRDYMSRARSNDFIMGRGARSAEHANWRCSIEYLLSSRGMKKVIEETKEYA